MSSLSGWVEWLDTLTLRRTPRFGNLKNKLYKLRATSKLTLRVSTGVCDSVVKNLAGSSTFYQSV